MLNRFNNSHALLAALKPWKGYGTGVDGAVVISSNTVVSKEYNARTFVLKAGAKLTTTRKQPIIIRAHRSITIEANAEIDADGRGYIYSEAGKNIFGLAQSTNGSYAYGSIGISGGGAMPDNRTSRAARGGQAVPVATFASWITQNFETFLTVSDPSTVCDIFGGGGYIAAQRDDTVNYSAGGGCILLVAPTITISGYLHARGLAGQGGWWSGGGGGGGGLIGIYGNTFNNNGTYDVVGGGGGGGAWNSYGNDGSWQNGGASPGGGYSRGGAGGGSTALNADGGTPGVGGSGTQYQGAAGSTNGTGGAGGNEGGSDRGGAGGSGGGAGKISWLQINK